MREGNSPGVELARVGVTSFLLGEGCNNDLLVFYRLYTGIPIKVLDKSSRFLIPYLY